MANAMDIQAKAAMNTPGNAMNFGLQHSRDLVQQTDEGFKDAIATFFSGAATIATFFAGFTLNIVVSVDPIEQRRVQLWASISSILFVNAAMLSTSFGVMVAFYQGRLLELLRLARDGVDTPEKSQGVSLQSLRFWILLPPLAIYVLTVAGVVFFLMVVYAYEQAVGIAGFVTAGIGAFVGAFWLVTILGLVLFKREKLDAPF